jgi:hypothetical protein
MFISGFEPSAPGRVKLALLAFATCSRIYMILTNPVVPIRVGKIPFKGLLLFPEATAVVLSSSTLTPSNSGSVYSSYSLLPPLPPSAEVVYTLVVSVVDSLTEEDDDTVSPEAPD